MNHYLLESRPKSLSHFQKSTQDTLTNQIRHKTSFFYSTYLTPFSHIFESWLGGNDGSWLPSYCKIWINRLGRKAMTNLDSILKSKDITLLTKVCIVKFRVFPVVMYRCESWTIKKAECRRIDVFDLWCWRRLLRVPWTARQSNKRKSVLNIHCKDQCWSSKALATWCEELTP